jgi:hypothetical protein
MRFTQRTDPNRTLPRVIELVAWLSSAYPAILVLILFGSWVVAWAVLGRQPNPYSDDPRTVTHLFAISHNIFFVMGVLFFPVGLAILPLVVLQLVNSFIRTPRRSIVFAFVPLLLWLLALVVLVCDPGSAVNWLGA